MNSKQNIGVVAVTVAVFLGGLATGVWTQRTRIGGAPFPLLHEFGEPQLPGRGMERDPQRFAETRKEIEAYQEKFAALREKYHARIVAVLNDDQRKIFAARHERGPRPGGAPGEGFPPRPEFRHGPGPLELPIIGMVFYKPLVGLMAAELKLDAGQKEKIEAILLERRAEFLQLIDQQPPPTFLQGPGAPPE